MVLLIVVSASIVSCTQPSVRPSVALVQGETPEEFHCRIYNKNARGVPWTAEEAEQFRARQEAALARVVETRSTWPRNSLPVGRLREPWWLGSPTEDQRLVLTQDGHQLLELLLLSWGRAPFWGAPIWTDYSFRLKSLTHPIEATLYSASPDGRVICRRSITLESDWTDEGAIEVVDDPLLSEQIGRSSKVVVDTSSDSVYLAVPLVFPGFEDVAAGFTVRFVLNGSVIATAHAWHYSEPLWWSLVYRPGLGDPGRSALVLQWIDRPRPFEELLGASAELHSNRQLALHDFAKTRVWKGSVAVQVTGAADSLETPIRPPAK